VDEINTKEYRLFTDSAFVKLCLLPAAEDMCPDKKRSYQGFILSVPKCKGRIQEFGTNIFEQLNLQAK
jgi:hypothetical protein